MKRAVLYLIAILMAIGLSGCFSKPEAGEIGVVRNGGPLDNKSIRQIVPNGNGPTWVGWFSQTHYYPADTQQRFFTLSNTQGADAAPVTVPTSDGVETSIAGTFYLYTGFDNSAKGHALLKAFDTQFGTRTFGGYNLHAWEGADGWKAWLTQIVEPVIANNLRETVSGVTCAQLISSCALVQNNGNTRLVRQQTGNNQSNIRKIQDQINTNLTADLRNTLGQDYFKNIRFTLRVVTLPPEIQKSINEAQGSFAQVTQSQAKVQSAKADAQANRLRQAGYRACPACAGIDRVNAWGQALKGIPPGVHTFAPGSGFAVTP